MKIDIEQVKKLKSMTGAGITDAKQALVESKGDFDKALEAMRIKGLAKADKKAVRATAAGLVDAYVHDNRIGVVVEVNCETDFVARTDDFKSYVHDLALHIAAAAPLYVSKDDVPEDDLNKERKLIEAELKESGKKGDMVKKIAEGKINKWYEQVCLMDQAFVKDPDQKIEDLNKSIIAKLGENIVISNFKRIELGAEA